MTAPLLKGNTRKLRSNLVLNRKPELIALALIALGDGSEMKLAAPAIRSLDLLRKG